MYNIYIHMYIHVFICIYIIATQHTISTTSLGSEVCNRLIFEVLVSICEDMFDSVHPDKKRKHRFGIYDKILYIILVT